MSEDFSNHPKTIGELQRERTDSCDVGTPRDILIEMLREIDSGISKPSAMVICYREEIGGESYSRFLSACPDGLVAQGLLSRIIWRMNE
ncbi:hypothetical protein HGP16_25520 [Rhizobium sp. P40RR-XXII]|uniref:hypothetical protein n=1 Tax=Rhizobium sp. P40RR-XXII TaxID=2726739 RepID=UPI0014570307|nr:hypothetical protein [Rhizobium sp. P40RR-XXII]NLS19902.1 hypothetical protein [Rhizobium sp. P40RR-XXII]